MTVDEKHEWMLLFVSDEKTQDQTFPLAEIKRVLGMADGDALNFNITENFWTDYDTKYLTGEMVRNKLPITNLRDRLNAVEFFEKKKHV